jgi:hypothetical protein
MTKPDLDFQRYCSYKSCFKLLTRKKQKCVVTFPKIAIIQVLYAQFSKGFNNSKIIIFVDNFIMAKFNENGPNNSQNFRAEG